jgi:UDP-2-acetamido-3-amino-2,3-dideoxy-glucuronate N-acetyltransferase
MENNVFIHPSSYVDEGVVLGKGCKVWHFCHLMGPSEIGEGCNFGQNVVVSPQVRLGKNVKVQNNVSIYTGVECEDNVFLGPSMVFTNVYNPRSAVSRKHEYRKTLVREGATIGANATIVCGIEIGRFAFIGAGALVNRAVPDFALIVGNPGRQIGWMSRFGQRLFFDERGMALCPESKIRYRRISETEIEETDNG